MTLNVSMSFYNVLTVASMDSIFSLASSIALCWFSVYLWMAIFLASKSLISSLSCWIRTCSWRICFSTSLIAYYSLLDLLRSLRRSSNYSTCLSACRDCFSYHSISCLSLSSYCSFLVVYCLSSRDWCWMTWSLFLIVLRLFSCSKMRLLMWL